MNRIKKFYKRKEFPETRNPKFEIPGAHKGGALLVTRYPLLVTMILVATVAWGESEVRIKDVAKLKGVRENQLMGYGLVVGLKGTGDSKSSLAINSVGSLLEKLGLTPGQTRISSRNIAAVIVTATLPPFAREGERIDVTVSSIADAKSLEGGILLQTPLIAADGITYLVAQGTIAMGGTVGTIIGGGLIESPVISTFIEDDTIGIELSRADFLTAARIGEAIKKVFPDAEIRVEDAQEVRVRIPDAFKPNPVDFISVIENLTINPDIGALVVISERNGTVVMGEGVRVSRVVVSREGLSISVTPVEEGETSPVVKEENILLFEAPGTVKDIVDGLNAIGATTRDIIAIFQALHQAGALHARLIITP